MSLANGVHTEAVQGSFALGFHPGRLIAAIEKNTDTRFNLYKCIYDEGRGASPFANSSSTACFTNTALSERHTHRVGTTISKRLTSCMKRYGFSTRWRHS